MSFLKRTEQPLFDDLPGIFKEQEKLMELYKPISNPTLPDWPMDLSNRDNQRILKSFMGDVIEELGEYFEHCMETVGLLIDSNPQSIHLLAIKHAEMNEELSDALHFLVEVFIFVNITPNTFANFFYDIMKQQNIGEKFTNYPIEDMNILEAGLFIAKLSNNEEIDHVPTSFNIRTNEDKFDYTGARFLSPKMLPNISKLCWYTTYGITKAKSTLKNKAWKQTDVSTNQTKLHNSLIETFSDLLRLFDYLGFTSSEICKIYYRKNQENTERIKSKY